MISIQQLEFQFPPNCIPFLGHKHRLFLPGCEMENVGLSGKKSLINVLTQGRELANELKRMLHHTIIWGEACDALENVLSSYENALTLLPLLGNGDSSQLSLSNLYELPNSIEGAPRSEGSDQKSKKRKTISRWSEQGGGYEGPFNDGYSWRKYGQKDILGANHPRAYYRCIHRNTQGCLATKQVQRADGDPSIFEVIYRGRHSCRQERQRQKKVKKEDSLKQLMMVRSEPVGKAETQELGYKEEQFPSFSFPPALIESENVDSPFFPSLSWATSDSYFSPLPCLGNDFGVGHSLRGWASDYAETVTKFSLEDLDFVEALDDFTS